ncbi:MAG: hypothetical protein CL816_01080 [Coxiellaceae bacterium]|nr:hypothetical protein [Coxiellaceae bacterium]
MENHTNTNSWRETLTVSSKKRQHQYIKIIILLGIVFLVIVIWFHVCSNNLQPSVLPESHLTHTDNTDLSRNLKSIHAQPTVKSDSPEKTQQLSLSRQDQRLIDIRRQAPMLIYSKKSGKIPVNPREEGSTWGDVEPYAAFVNQRDIFSHVEKAQMMDHPEWTIVAGEMIPAILETAISSDLPGMVRAVTRYPVYAFKGHRVLIPAGSRLLGQYSSMTMQGINRLCIIWHRLILPSGITISIDSLSSDSLGRSGQAADHINTHFIQRFQQGVLLSSLAAGASTVGVSSSDNNNSSSEFREHVANHLQQASQDSVSSRSHIKPTLSVNQGSLLKVFVAKDLSFYDVGSR